MAVRSIVGANKARNGNFELSPGNTPMTNSLGRWIDGTASGSLVNDTYGWWQITGVGSVAGSFDNSYKHSGSNSLKIDLNATGRGRVMSAPFETTTTKDLITKYGIPIKANTSYILNAYVASVNAIAGIGRVILQQYDINGTLLSSTNTTLLPAGTNDWTLLTLTLTTNAAAAYAVINCNCNTAGQAQTYWFDDIYFNKTVPDTRTTTTSRTLASNRVLTRDMGTALSFGASNTDKVRLFNTSNQIWNGNTDVTIEQWIKPTAFGASYTFSHPDTVGNNRTYISTDSTGKLTCTASSPLIDTGVTMVKNRWYHVVFVKDRTNSLYWVVVNGVAVKTATAYTPGTAAGTDIFIGNQSNASTQAWNGVIKGTSLFTRTMSISEAQQRYYSNVLSRTNLAGEWLFNETTGTTALDSSGNGNNGTITGAKYTTDAALRARSLA